LYRATRKLVGRIVFASISGCLSASAIVVVTEKMIPVAGWTELVYVLNWTWKISLFTRKGKRRVQLSLRLPQFQRQCRVVLVMCCSQAALGPDVDNKIGGHGGENSPIQLIDANLTIPLSR
jgi:hypothetical protein